MEKQQRPSVESAIEAEIAKDPESFKVGGRAGQFSEDELLALRQRYTLLAGLSKGQLDTLNKRVLRKLDWRFLPCITLMLLMA